MGKPNAMQKFDQLRKYLNPRANGGLPQGPYQKKGDKVLHISDSDSEDEEAPRNSRDDLHDQPAIQAQPRDPNALSQRLLALFKLTCPIIAVVLLVTILILCVVLFNRIKRSPTSRNRGAPRSNPRTRRRRRRERQ